MVMCLLGAERESRAAAPTGSDMRGVTWRDRWLDMAPGHHGGKRAGDLINCQASMGLCGSPVLACAGKTVAPFLPFSLADLGGKLGLKPACSWFSFLFLIFLLFDRAAGFLPPRPREAKAGARRSCQGWPPLAATVRLGLDGIEHDGTLLRSGPSSSGLGGCF